METKIITKPGTHSQGTRLFTHQLITSEDLITFKQELLTEFEKLFKSYSTSMQRRWLKAHQVRKLLNISIGTLQTLKSNGILPYTKIGGVHFFDYEDIQRILQEGKNVRI
jgi:DNA-binding transcriptional MerR regulator